MLQCIISSKPLLDAILDENSPSLAKSCALSYAMYEATHKIHNASSLLDIVNEGSLDPDQVEGYEVYGVEAGGYTTRLHLNEILAIMKILDQGLPKAEYTFGRLGSPDPN